MDSSTRRTVLLENLRIVSTALLPGSCTTPFFSPATIHSSLPPSLVFLHSAVSAGDGVLLFDNPIYETEGVARKKGVKGSPDKADTRAHEMENIAILR